MLTLSIHTTVNTDVLPGAFREALLADLAAQGTVTAVDASRCLKLRDAVSVFTKQMRMHGYYPEKVLVAIKSAACDAAVPLVPEQLVTEIVQDAAQSCIGAYFEPEIDPRNKAGAAPFPVRIPHGAETPGVSRPATLLEHRP